MLRSTIALLLALMSAAATANGKELLGYAKPVLIGKLQNDKVTESSGLAVSRRNPDLFWTHNDSGDKARLYCFHRTGKHAGTCKLDKAGAIDWEDMCSFLFNGKPKLLVGDIGDNLKQRRSVRLYMIDEPKNPSKDVKDVQVIKLRYATGPMDCEAIAVDAKSEKLLLVEKARWLHCRVFEADFKPTRDLTEVVAKQIGRIPLSLVTAMDISADGRRAIVANMGPAYEYTRGEGETWATAFAKKPRNILMPDRKQGETICYGADGRDLFLTSEAKPTPFYLVKAIGAGAPPVANQ